MPFGICTADFCYITFYGNRKEVFKMDKNPKHPLKKKNKADAKKHQKHVYE